MTPRYTVFRDNEDSVMFLISYQGVPLSLICRWSPLGRTLVVRWHSCLLFGYSRLHQFTPQTDLHSIISATHLAVLPRH